MPTSPEGSSGLNCKVYKYDNASPPQRQEVPKVFEIGDIGGAAPDRIELTHHGVTDFTRRYVRSFKDPGTIPISCNFLPGNAIHQQIIADDATGASSRWRVEFPTNPEDYVEFDGAPSISTSQGMEARLTLNFTITVEGTLSWHYANPTP